MIRALNKYKWASEKTGEVKQYLDSNLAVTGESDSRGVIFRNFPSSQDELQKLDEITDGLNLAIVFEAPDYDLPEDQRGKKLGGAAQHYDSQVIPN